MKRNKCVSGFLKTGRSVFLLLFCALLFDQTIPAQSGRKTTKKTSAEPVVAADSDSAAKKQTERISAIKVTGEIQYDSGWHSSNYLGIALRECVSSLQSRPQRPVEVVKGDKMKLNDAKELAKKDADNHVLWLGFFVKSYSYGLDVIEYVDYIDYAMMRPGTAKVVTYGRVELGKPNMGNAGTILKIPTSRRSSSELSQLKQGANEIANILMRGGWLD